MLWFEAIGFTLFLIGLFSGLTYLGQKYPKVFAAVMITAMLIMLTVFVHFLLSIRQ